MIKKEDCEITVTPEEEDIPVRGNVLVSDDPVLDKECEDAIINRLNSGDIWAWCCVKVTVKWKSFSHTTYLGGCSYNDEADFKGEGGYFDELVNEAVAGLNESVKKVAEELKEAGFT